MSNNRTFFKNVKAGNMSLKDIFSDVTKKHTPEESARVLIAGTPLTTPRESEMLAGWQKPYLFARFFGICLIIILLSAFMVNQGYLAHDILLVTLTLVGPVTLLILAWEMNIPRDISLIEVLKLVAVGGMLSLIITVIFNVFKRTFALTFQNTSLLTDAVWAPLVEEPAKLAVIYLVLKRKNHKYILDGVLIGMAVGTGFAVMETLGYVMDAMREGIIETLMNTMAYELQSSSAASVLDYYIDLASNDLSSLTYALLKYGFADGVQTAIRRGAGSLASHGTYAALYGGGLMIAKGSHPVELKHLLHLDHLKYFAVSCLLHAANNSMIAAYVMYLFGSVYAWAIVESVIAMLIFLPLLRKGVNQVVELSAAHNGGRVTVAVNRPVSDGPVAAASVQLECITGPNAGKSYAISEGQSLTLGRSSACNIAMPSAGNVSSNHCVVRMQGGQLTVTDQDSTNGTYVADRRLTPHVSTPISDGAVITLGSRNCAFRVRMR